MSQRRVTIVILCWNRWSLTRRCLETLAAHTDLSTVEVIAVDNGSTDETPAELARLSWVRCLRLPENLGFVRGNNAALAAADPATDVLLLNNDVEILHGGWVEALRRSAHAAPDIGVVGCRLVQPDGKLLHAGTYILPDTCWGQQIGGGERDVGQYAADRDVQGVVFACAYLKRELLDAAGHLSEEYGSYFEDTDYCLRAAAAGFRTVCCGAVTILHHQHGSTSDTPQLFQEIFATSRKTFRRRWREHLEGLYRRDVSWQSIVNAPTGYAMSSREILRALDDAGVRASYSYVYGPGTPWPYPETAIAGDHRLAVIAERKPRRPAVSVVYAQGDVFRRNHGRTKVGYTMLEVDGFPDDWVRQANDMDEVWVPSEFNRAALLRCGARRPVHVMPLGVDPHHFHPGIKAAPNPRGDFVFLSSFEWGERKLPELLLRVFNATFGRDEGVVLVCKVMNRDPGVKVRDAVRGLNLRPEGGRIGFIHNREVPYEELGVLYRSADCYLSTGRGEGWDMPLMEAMACGLPAIATDWGAHTMFAHEGIAYPLRVRGTVPAVAKCPYYAGFSWADPDPEHLAVLLRHVFEHREEAAAKGRRAAAEMAARWSWGAAAARIATRLSLLGARGCGRMRPCQS